MKHRTATYAFFAVCLAVLLCAGLAGAQTVDFESSAYLQDKSFVGLDGWSRMYKADSAVPAANLMIRAESGNKMARCLTTHQGSVYREFPGASAYLDMRWRWRADNDFVHMCFGVSRFSTIDGFYPLALACIEPSGVMEAKGALASLLTGVKWLPQKWIYMRMVLDAAKSTFTLYLANDSLRGDERQIQGPAPLNDQGQTLSRVVIRAQNGAGSVDIDDIQWTPLASLASTAPTVQASPRDTLVPIGGKASFRVSISPKAGSSFQWTRNGADIAGATDTVLSVTASRLADSADYACRVIGAWGGFPTATAKLRVSFPAPSLSSTSGGVNRLNVTLASNVAGARIFSRNADPSGNISKAAVGEYQEMFSVAKPVRVQAFATLGADTSAPGEWIFSADPVVPQDTLHTSVAAPSAFPAGRTFPDTLRVSLSAPAGAAILYTRDGSDPRKAGKPYTGGILLDSTAVLKALAVIGQDTSAALSQTYRLVPEVVRITPAGGTYTDRIQITLAASTAKASLYYTLDGSAPNTASAGDRYAGPFNLGSNATLNVVAMVGQDPLQKGPARQEGYAFVDAGPQVLKPAARLDLAGGYSVYAPAGSQDLAVALLGSDSLGSIQGFRDVRLVLRLAPTKAGDAFPVVEFSSPAGEQRALYLLEPVSTQTDAAPKARFMGNQGKAVLSAPGTYFLAVDTLAPSITLLKETFISGDSTCTEFRIEDNTTNPTIALTRSDDARLDFTGKTFASGGTLSATLKNEGGKILPLTLRVSASDRWSTVSFPPEHDRPLLLAQKIAASRRTPDLFRLDGSSSRPWDLITLPLLAEPGITLDQLRGQNPGCDLRGAIWNDAARAYRFMEGGETFQAGVAVWMTSLGAPLTSLVLPAAQTLSQAGGNLSVTLRKGWNQIGNPTLGTLYWPFSREATPDFNQGPIKMPFAYSPATGGYSVSDSLEPWRGYFVENKGGDTTIILLPVRPQAAAGAKSAARLPSLSLALRLRNATLYLGASDKASDGLGIEDEQNPPLPSARRDDALQFASARQSRSLVTDILRWHSGASYRWRVVTRLPSGPAGPESTFAGQAQGARVENLELPQGYAAWAVSRLRGVRVPLDRDGVLPAFPGFTDSLDVFAGPAALLESELGAIPTAVPAFEAGVAETPGGFALAFRLPGSYRISWAVYALDGRALASGSARLPTGNYRIDPGSRAASAPGIRLLCLEWASTDGTPSSGRRSQRVVIH